MPYSVLRTACIDESYTHIQLFIPRPLCGPVALSCPCQAYFASVSFVDQHIGALIAEIDTQNFTDSTVVVFMYGTFYPLRYIAIERAIVGHCL